MSLATAPSYESIAHLVASRRLEGSWLLVEFRCPESGRQVHARAPLQRSQSFRSMATRRTQENLRAGFRMAVFQSLGQSLGHGLGGRIARDVAGAGFHARDQARRASGQEWSEDELRAGVVRAFDSVRMAFVQTERGWVGLPTGTSGVRGPLSGATAAQPGPHGSYRVPAPSAGGALPSYGTGPAPANRPRYGTGPSPANLPPGGSAAQQGFGSAWQPSVSQPTTPQRPADGDPSAQDFDSWLRQHPPATHYDRGVLARMLVELARSDGDLAIEESALIARLIDPSLGQVEEIARRPPLSALELAETSRGPQRHTLLTCAWILAFTDRRLDAAELRLLAHFGAGLELDPAARDQARDRARGWLFEQALAPAYQGGYQPQAHARALALAREIGLPEHEAHRRDIAYRKRNLVF